MSAIVLATILTLSCGQYGASKTAVDGKQPNAAKPKAAPQKPGPKVVKSWNFAKLDKEKWDWTFPGGKPQKAPGGAFYVTRKSGPGFQLNLGDAPMNCADATVVRIEVELTQQKPGADKATDVAVAGYPILYWVSPERAATVKDAWPFDNDHRIGLVRPNPKTPNVWESRLTRNPAWKDKVQRVMISIPTPDGTPDYQPYNVIVKKIEFLK
jgi:hypothetical protein